MTVKSVRLAGEKTSACMRVRNRFTCAFEINLPTIHPRGTSGYVDFELSETVSPAVLGRLKGGGGWQCPRPSRRLDSQRNRKPGPSEKNASSFCFPAPDLTAGHVTNCGRCDSKSTSAHLVPGAGTFENKKRASVYRYALRIALLIWIYGLPFPARQTSCETRRGVEGRATSMSTG